MENVGVFLCYQTGPLAADLIDTRMVYLGVIDYVLHHHALLWIDHPEVSPKLGDVEH